jgi:hypothetical protein
MMILSVPHSTAPMVKSCTIGATAMTTIGRSFQIGRHCQRRPEAVN